VEQYRGKEGARPLPGARRQRAGMQLGRPPPGQRGRPCAWGGEPAGLGVRTGRLLKEGNPYTLAPYAENVGEQSSGG